jgi:hypothetical protein
VIRPLPALEDDAKTILRGLEAARQSRTPDGKSHAIVDGGRHVQGQLLGATPTHVFLDHHAVPLKSVLAAATPTQKAG